MAVATQKTTLINARVTPDIKRQAEKIYSELGISMSSAIEVFLRATVREQGMPVKMSLATEPAKEINADKMSAEDLWQRIRQGVAEADTGKGDEFSQWFAKFKQEQGIN